MSHRVQRMDSGRFQQPVAQGRLYGQSFQAFGNLFSFRRRHYVISRIISYGRKEALMCHAQLRTPDWNTCHHFHISPGFGFHSFQKNFFDYICILFIIRHQIGQRQIIQPIEIFLLQSFIGGFLNILPGFPQFRFILHTLFYLLNTLRGVQKGRMIYLLCRYKRCK